MAFPESLLSPAITGIFGLAIGIFGAIMARRGQKIGSQEQRAPDVQEMWSQQESDRRMRQLVEDLWWGLRGAFQSYFRRVTTTANQLHLPPEVAAKFELTEKEQKAISANPPDDE